MSEERLNPFVPLGEDGKPIEEEPKKEEVEVKRLTPFIPVTSDKDKPPEQKMYLLLLNINYPDEEDTVQKWKFVSGRLEARMIIVDLIKEGVLDVHNSYIAVEGPPFSDDLPTVYTLFTDPRSSWSNSELFGDDFRIEDYVEGAVQDNDDTSSPIYPNIAHVENPDDAAICMHAMDIYNSSYDPTNLPSGEDV